MSISGKRFLLAAGLLGSVLAATAPAMAHGGGGGGGGHAGGGGHSAGVGHGGGGGGHFAGGAGHYSGDGAHFTGASHGYVGASGHSYATAFRGGGYSGHAAYAGHGGYGYPGHAYYGGHGYSTGAYWRGGYWGGGFWPRAYYGGSFAWYLPVLPLAYATYWYSGVPYYYANDVYYTYNPSYEGYVATDPPPVADAGAVSSTAPVPTDLSSGAPPSDQGSGQMGQLFLYPKNGQSAQQQETDKAECQQWATDQAGQVAQNPSNYNRAMVACVEGRGYTAR